MRYKPSQMRHRVAVQKRVDAPTGSFNEIVATYTTVATRWAQVSPLEITDQSTPADEREEKQQQVSLRRHHVFMRYFDGLDSGTHRLVYQGRVLSILSAHSPDEQRVYHALVCVERVNA